MFWYLSALPRMQACARASATMITELCTRQNEKATFNCDVWEFREVDMIFDWAIL